MKVLSKSPLIFEAEANLLEGRRDVFYYNPKFLKLKKKLYRGKYELKKIGDIIKFIYRYPTFYGINYLDHGIRVLKVKNIINGEIVLAKEESFISREDNLRFKKTILKERDLIFSVRGTIGKVGFITKDFEGANINANLIKISLIDNINHKYVWVYLNSQIGQTLINNMISGTVQSTITIPDIKTIIIPIPPKEIQDKVAKIIINACQQKKQKIQTANNLLEEISKIIIKELGIKIQDVKEKLIYWLNPNDLEERRDPIFYSPKYLYLFKAIEKSHYKSKLLKEIAKVITSGQRPQGGVKYIEDGRPSIGGEHITSKGDFNFEKIRFIPKEFHQKQKKSWIKPLDVLIVKDGATTGKVAIISEKFPFKKCNINEHVFKIELKEGFNSYYVFSFLFSFLGQEQIKRLISGAAQKGITKDAIESILITLPPLKVQDKIANEVKRRKEISKELEKDAEDIMEKARKEVEDIIFRTR